MIYKISYLPEREESIRQTFSHLKTKDGVVAYFKSCGTIQIDTNENNEIQQVIFKLVHMIDQSEQNGLTMQLPYFPVTYYCNIKGWSIIEDINHIIWQTIGNQIEHL